MLRIFKEKRYLKKNKKENGRGHKTILEAGSKRSDN